MYRYYIGIDCGVNTGYAIYSREKKELECVISDSIHRFIIQINEYFITGDTKDILFVIEDAGQVRFNIKETNLQGTASVRRDAKIWHDYLTAIGANFLMVRPKKSITKLSTERFKEITGWSERTNEHGRDAAMLVWGATYTPQQVLLAMEKLKGKKASVKIKKNALSS